MLCLLCSFYQYPSLAECFCCYLRRRLVVRCVYHVQLDVPQYYEGNTPGIMRDLYPPYYGGYVFGCLNVVSASAVL